MRDAILNVLKYFAGYQYPPSLSEMHTFLNVPSDMKKLRQILIDSIGKNIIVSNNKVIGLNSRFTIPKNETFFEVYTDRYSHSNSLKKDMGGIQKIMSKIPTVLLIGISGSLSMANSEPEDDIDIFIVTKSGTIWTTRFILLILKRLIWPIYPISSKKLCFNLFFSERGLRMDTKLQTPYIGHEILQLKVLVDKDKIKDKMLYENRWMTRLFPNSASQPLSESANQQKYKGGISSLDYIIEKILERIQIWWLNIRKYKFKNYKDQLWLIQEEE